MPYEKQEVLKMYPARPISEKLCKVLRSSPPLSSNSLYGLCCHTFVFRSNLGRGRPRDFFRRLTNVSDFGTILMVIFATGMKVSVLLSVFNRTFFFREPIERQSLKYRGPLATVIVMHGKPPILGGLSSADRKHL